METDFSQTIWFLGALAHIKLLQSRTTMVHRSQQSRHPMAIHVDGNLPVGKLHRDPFRIPQVDSPQAHWSVSIIAPALRKP